MRHLTVRMFGAFRELEPSGTWRIEIDEAATVADVRRAFEQQARARWGARFDPALLAASAFASEREVLRASDSVAGLDEVAVLPPVSGG
jgi:sulfur-carrier protein